MSGDDLVARLRTGLHAYRQLGARRVTATVARRAASRGRSRLRGIVLQHRPVRVTAAELRGALGGKRTSEALAAAGDALPSARRWRAELARLDHDARADLVSRADQVIAHRFDLLGSGPTELGPVIDWHRDFKSGRTWPLRHFSTLPITYPDSSDIKVPWELSRSQHLPLLAGAHVLTGERRYLDELGAQLTSWIDSNPVEFGVNWACTMDVAIRAVNWIAALVVSAEELSDYPWLDRAVASLLAHGRFVRSHLEDGVARGNHYLSDVVGLLVVSALFSASDEGRTWAGWAVSELAREMRHQVRADGCDHEASTSYHRLVTELFIVGADAADAIVPGALDPIVRAGIDRMLAFVADYTRPDGLAPQIGDADDGRLLPLGDHGSADQRSHRHLFRQAGRTPRSASVSAAYPDGGFYFLRGGDLYAAVRCGDVGIYGRGCHAHNDLLAFELCYGDTPLILDPGSYLYTADPSARNLFRSTGVHSTLQIDHAEQNELREDRLFAMVDRARPELLAWEVNGAMTTFSGRHRGFDALPDPAIHTRTLRLDGEAQRLEIVDEVASAGSHELTWHFPLAPCELNVRDGSATASFERCALRFETDHLAASVHQGWISPAYGSRLRSPLLRFEAVSTPGTCRTSIVLSLI